jgi:hypothetical protein
MPRNQNAVEKGLKAKGFEPKDGDHHYFIYHTKVGKKTSVFTKTSHSGKELSDSLIGFMAKQCKLSKANFLQLVDCPMSRDAYEADLISRGIVREEPSRG